MSVAIEGAFERLRLIRRVHADRHPNVGFHVDVGGEGDRFAAHVVSTTLHAIQTIYV